MTLHNLILSGDLNFIKSPSEVWGADRPIDSLADYFTNLFDGAHLVDILPGVLGSTWSNV